MVDGTTQAKFSFKDPNSDREISVTLSVRDGILFKLLEKISEELKNK